MKREINSGNGQWGPRKDKISQQLEYIELEIH
jgi:hypothetical protein